MGDSPDREQRKRERAEKLQRSRRIEAHRARAQRWSLLSNIGNQAMLEQFRYERASPLDRQRIEEEQQKEDEEQEQYLEDVKTQAHETTSHDIALRLAELKSDLDMLSGFEGSPQVDLRRVRLEKERDLYQAELQTRPETEIQQQYGAFKASYEAAQSAQSEDRQELYDAMRVLEDELRRQRALSVPRPTTVTQAIAMIGEARQAAEGPLPDEGRAYKIVGAVHDWIEEVASLQREDEKLGGKAFAYAPRMMVGAAKSQVAHIWMGLSPRGGWTIGGQWDYTVNTLKAAQDTLEILDGERDYKGSKTENALTGMKEGSYVTLAGAAGLMAAPVVIAPIAEAAVPVIASEAGLFSTAVRMGGSRLYWWAMTNPTQSIPLAHYLFGQGVNMCMAGGPEEYLESLQHDPLQLLMFGMETWQLNLNMSTPYPAPSRTPSTPPVDVEPTPTVTPPRQTPVTPPVIEETPPTPTVKPPSTVTPPDDTPTVPRQTTVVPPTTPPDVDQPVNAPAVKPPPPPTTTPPTGTTTTPPVTTGSTTPTPKAVQMTWRSNPAPQMATTVTTPIDPLADVPTPLPRGDSPRGQVVEPAVIKQRYPGSTPLPPNFKTFDATDGGQTTNVIAATPKGQANLGVKIEGGRAISIKSIDTTAKTYQDADSSYKGLKGYVNDIIDFDRYTLSQGKAGQAGRYTVTLVRPTDRVLHLELTGPPSPGLLEGLRLLGDFAALNKIKLVVVAPTQ